MKHLKSFALISLIVSFLTLHAQDEIKFNKISLANGLSNTEIQKIYQDSKGFMWFGTADGLNKYDGYDFKTYRQDPKNNAKFLGSMILSIFEDSRGTLWVGTESALNKYDNNKDEFKSFRFDSTSVTEFYNGITAIYEDARGEFWIGKAFSGLTKFDRKSEKFFPFDGDTSSYPYGVYAVFDIQEDEFNNLWFSKAQNFQSKCEIYSLDSARSTVRNIRGKITKGNNELSLSPFIFIDKSNKVWLNSLSGSSWIIDPVDMSCELIDWNEKPSIIRMNQDNRGNYWFSTLNTGIMRYFPSEKNVKYFKRDGDDIFGLSSNNVTEIFIDRTGIFWAAVRGFGLNKFEPYIEPITTARIEYKVDNERRYSNIFGLSKSLSSPDIIWIASNSGIHRYSRNTKSIAKFAPEELQPYIINSLITSLREDAQNNLWIGTNNKGIVLFNLISKTVSVYNTEQEIKTLPGNLVRHLEIDSRGNVWVSTNQGLARISPVGDHVESFKYMDTTYSKGVFDKLKLIRRFSTPVASIVKARDDADSTKEFILNSPKSLLVVSIGEAFNLNNELLWDFGWIENDEGDLLWMVDSANMRHAGGADKNKIYIQTIELDKGGYRLKYSSDDSHSYNNWNDSPPVDPEYWGIQIYEIGVEEKKFFEENLSSLEFGNTISGENVITTFEDSKGRIWIGTLDSGLNLFLPSENKFLHYESATRNLMNFSINRVNSIYEDNAGFLWLATYGGLVKINIEEEQAVIFNSEDGLPTNYMEGILQDNFGNIWVSSRAGITKFKPREDDKAPTFINFDLGDGIQGLSFNRGAALKTETGRVFFGGENGINKFFPGEINSIPPSIVINRFLISNQNITPSSPRSPISKNIMLLDTLTLNYDQNDISFEYKAIHFARPEKNKYAHKLEGHDEDWIYSDKRIAIYTNLDPGNYTLLVKASNSDGVWTENPRRLSISIMPPWWNTVWAYILYCAIALGIILGFDRYRKRRILARERERQREREANYRIEKAELQAKAAEAQTRAIEAENKRKTQELEEARKLQLSMLPQDLPNLPHLDIAVYMSTATEVGGDYYDFHVDLDGSLTVVSGDATGHGLNAGTVVTITKSLFKTHAENPDIVHTFNEISKMLKQMEFRLLAMCLSILKIRENRARIASAGMPPILIFRARTGEVEEILLSGMPLGTSSTFPYNVQETTLHPGDTILLMSDGYPELFNQYNEMFGYERVKQHFAGIGKDKPEEIINSLKYSVSEWTQDREIGDDITFVVIKMA